MLKMEMYLINSNYKETCRKNALDEFSSYDINCSKLPCCCSMKYLSNSVAAVVERWVIGSLTTASGVAHRSSTSWARTNTFINNTQWASETARKQMKDCIQHIRNPVMNVPLHNSISQRPIHSARTVLGVIMKFSIPATTLNKPCFNWTQIQANYIPARPKRSHFVCADFRYYCYISVSLLLLQYLDDSQRKHPPHLMPFDF